MAKTRTPLFQRTFSTLAHRPTAEKPPSRGISSPISTSQSPPQCRPGGQRNAIIIGSNVESANEAARGQHLSSPPHRRIWLRSPSGAITCTFHNDDDSASAAVDAVASRIRPRRALLINDRRIRRIRSTPRAPALAGLARFQRQWPGMPPSMPNPSIILDASPCPSPAVEAIIERVIDRPRYPSLTSRPDTIQGRYWCRYCRGEGPRFALIAKFLPKRA